MTVKERLKWTLIIASGFILVMAVGETVAHLLLREPIDHHYWHSLISVERFIGAGPISLLFGWFYPQYMQRVFARNAKKESVNQEVARKSTDVDSRVRMTSLLDPAPHVNDRVSPALVPRIAALVT